MPFLLNDMGICSIRFGDSVYVRHQYALGRAAAKMLPDLFIAEKRGLSTILIEVTYTALTPCSFRLLHLLYRLGLL